MKADVSVCLADYVSKNLTVSCNGHKYIMTENKHVTVINLPAENGQFETFPGVHF